METALLRDRRELEASKYRGQFLIFEWLFYHGPVGEAVSQTPTGVAGRIEKRYFARGKRLRHYMAIATIQVHIQHRDVEDLLIDQGEGPIDGLSLIHISEPTRRTP